MESTIEAAKELAEKFGNDIIVVLAYNSQTGLDTVITWGKELSQSEYAATMGNKLKSAIGWKPEDSNAVSAKTQAIIDNNLAIMEFFKKHRLPAETDEEFIERFDKKIKSSNW